jgi:hypothetical protein
MKNKISLLLTIIIVLTSCTMQKRYHNSGFNLGLNGHFTRSNKSASLLNKSAQKAIRNPNAQSSKVESNKSTLTEANIPFNTSDVRDVQESDVLPFGVVSTQTHIFVNPMNSVSQFKLTKTGVHQVGVKSLKANSVVNGATLKLLKKSASSEGGGSGLRGVGVFLLIIGIIVLLLVSIIAGIFLSVLGLLLMSSGKSSPEPVNTAENVVKEEKKVEYIEVLYLKNGSIIKGMIIEQIPNVQVKIQTSDGSVFVYTMDQVLKITKEPK